MKKLLITLCFLLGQGVALASGGGANLEYFRVDTQNLGNLQEGARNYMAYCSGCHSMKYLRYSRMAKDLGIPEDLLKKNLMWTTSTPTDSILSAMPNDSADWFGQIPPDLSLETRARGPEWVYTYLKSFYVDEKRPLGVNNTVLVGASMPHVLWELQGWQKPVYSEHEVIEDGKPVKKQHLERLEVVQPGKLNAQEYDRFISDITNFMVYAAEPARNDRLALGWKVWFFLLIFGTLAYLLNKEYWKDIH
jgi:ubiquinol-cytochrome c reductase cytochrome c1 subunit